MVKAPESYDTIGYFETANTGGLASLFDEHVLMDKATKVYDGSKSRHKNTKTKVKRICQTIILAPKIEDLSL